MERKVFEPLNMEVVLFTGDDVVRTSEINGGWDDLTGGGLNEDGTFDTPIIG